MKILFTVATYYPLVDGVQNITQFYAEGLVQKGHHVSVLTGDYGKFCEKEIINGVVIYRHDIWTKRGNYYGDIKGYLDKVKRLSEDIDLMINVCIQTATTDVILPFLDGLACKKVLYMHGMAELRFPGVEKVDLYDIKKWMFNNIKWRPLFSKWKKYIRNYDMIIHLHNQDMSMNYANKLCINNIVLENGADFKGEVKQQLSKKYWLCLSNYSRDKNQELVLKSFIESSTDKDLIFIGSENNRYLEFLKSIYKTEIKKIDKNHGKVFFKYNLSREETTEILGNAYALINGSKVEKYPVIICEAMACKVPFISTNVGIVERLPGGVIAKGKKEIISLMNYLDANEEYRVELGEEGYKYASSHQDMNKNLVCLEKELKNILNTEKKNEFN